MVLTYKDGVENRITKVYNYEVRRLRHDPIIDDKESPCLVKMVLDNMITTYEFH